MAAVFNLYKIKDNEESNLHDSYAGDGTDGDGFWISAVVRPARVDVDAGTAYRQWRDGRYGVWHTSC